MSLIHWWPLNGNLNDYGLEPQALNVLYNPTSFSNNGKIGKCSDLSSGGAYYIATPMICKASLEYSVCAWIKIPTINAGTRYAIWSNRSGGPVWSSCEIQNKKLCYYHYNNEWLAQSGNTQLSDDTWYHVVFVIKNNIVTFYLNGVLDGSGDATLSGDNNNPCDSIGCAWTASTSLYGYLNDVRIYDHALSAKEVKEISKGLVLHYDFNDPYVEGTTNLITGIAWTDNCTIEGNGVRVAWNVSAADTYLFFNTSEGMIDGQTYTFSFDVVGLHEENVVFAWSNINSEPYLVTLKNGRNSITFPGTSSELRTFFDDIYRNTVSNFWMGNFQLEKKDHATPYVNGTRQPGMVYDCSGYGYNGIPVGDIQVLPDSKYGKYCLFNNGTQIDDYETSGGIAYVRGDFGFLKYFEKITISFWANIIETFRDHSGVISLSSEASNPYDHGTGGLAQYDGVFRFNMTSGNEIMISQNISFNEWHHYAFTWDGTNLYMYKDGVRINSSTSSGLINESRYLYLGLNCAGGAWRKSKIKWGDFKIYSTALSAEDILAEYNRKASIDRNGNLFTGELVETTDNLADKANYTISAQKSFDGYLAAGSAKKSYYDSNFPNSEYNGLGTYTQGNLQVSLTSDGVRIYSEPNRDSGDSEHNTWGGLGFSPMKTYNCLIKGHRYVISWHVSGKSSRAMTDVYWTNQIGWGQYPDADPTINDAKLPPANFQGEMDCYYDFTINDEVFKTTTDSVHSGFEPNTTYLAYAAFKIGYTYGFTGELGNDMYITNLQMIDVTDNKTYKITKNGLVKTTQLISGQRNSARIHSDGMVNVTDIKEL